ncbi:type II toxin-antitoxin system HipA family toxin [Rubritalea spongiae]|uniref:Type II toxin-antitoxin system HipA family toxin n=1 Tax=Rubritalea spongiae TaxID=430797 RepID=A0ABW5E5X1_9BACT
MLAQITLWGRTIGAASLDDQHVCRFEYDSSFTHSGIEVSPLRMPLSPEIYAFPNLNHQTFHGLPGLLADSLPDKFGNALIDAWLATQGRPAQSLNAIERLCYTGTRGMGALEFEPSTNTTPSKTETLEISHLVELASSVLSHRNQLHTHFGEDDASALTDILRVGTSAGGARAKAVIAWNPTSHEVRSGQADTANGFEHWLLKFDGVNSNKDKELDDPQGYSALEYAYHLMATQAGIDMMPCRLLEENGRRHFMTQRFDRTADGKKLHMQSLCALAHYDFNLAGAYSYEQAFLAIRQLGLGMDSIEQQFRRMTFNIVARNQDDHVKNIAFLMDKTGKWSLSPAFDITYSYNPDGQWTYSHQMTLNGKRNDFTLEDFITCGKTVGLKRGRAKTILSEVTDTVNQWQHFADQAEINQHWTTEIAKTHRLKIH